LDLHKNNVFRLLATLEYRGYIEQSSSSERYRLSAKCLELGEAFRRSRSLIERARPILQNLAHTVGETAHLALMSSYEVVHLDSEVHERAIVTASRVGQRLPAHCTALGKVLLGLADEDYRRGFDEQVVKGQNLNRRTAATIVDPLKFFEHIRTVAGEGFALDIEECEEGLHCAAVPIMGADGQPIAAISVSAPAFRLSEDRLRREVLPLITGSADRLSRELGLLQVA
jgi:DNA-binding IclR family transcriptional regulator